MPTYGRKLPVMSSLVGRGGGSGAGGNSNPIPTPQNRGVVAAPAMLGLVIISAPVDNPQPGQVARQAGYTLMIQRAPGEGWTYLHRGTPGTNQLPELFAVRNPYSNAWVESHAPAPGQPDKHVNVCVVLRRSANGMQARAEISPRA